MVIKSYSKEQRHLYIKLIQLSVLILLISFSLAACSVTPKKAEPAPTSLEVESTQLPPEVAKIDKEATDLYSAKQYSQSIEKYDKAVAIEKKEPAILLARGRVKFQSRDYAGAEEDYSKALKLDEKNALAFHRRGYTRFEMGKFEESISDLNSAIKLKPDYVHAYNNRARAKSRLKDYEGAKSDYETVIRLDPNYILGYLNLVHLSLEISKVDDAIQYCDQGKERFEQVINGSNTPSSGSEVNLKESMPVDQQFAMLFHNCAMAKNKAGMKEAALSDMDRAISLTVNNKQYFRSVRAQIEK